MKNQLAIITAKTTYKFLRLLGRNATSLPGKIAQKIDPNLLETLAKDYRIAVITGTNGKTMTTNLAATAVSEIYPNIVSNFAGANMYQGVVGAFLEKAEKHTDNKPIAILEIDEGSLHQMVEILKPELYVVTNLFEDQIDRYGSTENVRQMLFDAFAKTPEAIVYLNADLPILTDVNLVNPVKYYGLDVPVDDTKLNDQHCPHCSQNKLNYMFRTYDSLGKYACSHCNFKRPKLDTSVTDIDSVTQKNIDFSINDVPFTLPLGGLYNIYNALAAFQIAEYFNIPDESIQMAFKKEQKIPGRQEIFNRDNKRIHLNLIKNKVGMEQSLHLLTNETEPFTLFIFINNQPADGEDISWLYQMDFNILNSMDIPKVYTGGMRVNEITEILRDYEILPEIVPITELSALKEAVKASTTEKIHIIASYTAMQGIRESL